MPISEAELGTFFGYVGLAVTILYFCSPLPTCISIVRKGDIEGFSALPYITGVFNCSLWVYYAWITMEATSQDLMPNLVCNFVGIVLWGAYVVIFLINARNRRREIVAQISVAVTLALLMICCFEGVVPHVNWDFHWGGPDMPLKSSVSGLVTDVINVCLYASPLVALSTVLRTKSVKYMPLALSMLTLAVSCLWCAQAVLIRSITVFVPQVLGILLGLAQLLLYAKYRNNDASAREALTASTGSSCEVQIADA
eukprot:gb/GFBE01055115.1/.p1 GENE.gb/GFBE01055115.1/~~gb/GFBE01055115.1/.p1  ORF type:complete len:254 (+),score=47.62 gb/GFBE01055115.1/:1-762(+)